MTDEYRQIQSIADACIYRYVGRSEVQVDAFLRDVVYPILEENKEL